jgi:uncharacterized protein (TIGR00299 family) protein
MAHDGEDGHGHEGGDGTRGRSEDGPHEGARHHCEARASGHVGGQGRHPGDAPSRAPLDRSVAGPNAVLFVDAFSGISGDMWAGALLDLGVPRNVIDAALGALPLDGYHVHVAGVVRSGIAATRFQVHVDEPQPERKFRDIRAMLERADLMEGTRRLALRAFEILADAEAAVHATTPDAVHFHEVGAVDSIVDIVAVAAGLDWLGAQVVTAPLPLGRGLVRTRHGVLPLPAPATVLALRGLPTTACALEDVELVTPTGAALLAAAAVGAARWPAMEPVGVGWGAGLRELPDRPNLLRLVLGRDGAAAQSESGGRALEPTHVLMETNVDDASPELVAHALARLLEAGALDAWAQPITMKKGRPAVTVAALAPRARLDDVVRVALSETTSLGVRVAEVWRRERPRRVVPVDTPYGPVRLKVADGDGLPENVAPEHDDCARAARAHGVPLKAVHAAALSAYGRLRG